MLGLDPISIPLAFMLAKEISCPKFEMGKAKINLNLKIEKASEINSKSQAEIAQIYNQKYRTIKTEMPFAYIPDVNNDPTFWGWTHKATKDQSCYFLSKVDFTIIHNARYYIAYDLSDNACYKKSYKKLALQLERNHAEFLRQKKRKTRSLIREFIERNRVFGPFKTSEQKAAIDKLFSILHKFVDPAELQDSRVFFDPFVAKNKEVFNRHLTKCHNNSKIEQASKTATSVPYEKSEIEVFTYLKQDQIRQAILDKSPKVPSQRPYTFLPEIKMKPEAKFDWYQTPDHVHIKTLHIDLEYLPKLYIPNEHIQNECHIKASKQRAQEIHSSVLQQLEIEKKYIKKAIDEYVEKNGKFKILPQHRNSKSATISYLLEDFHTVFQEQANITYKNLRYLNQVGNFVDLLDECEIEKDSN